MDWANSNVYKDIPLKANREILDQQVDGIGMMMMVDTEGCGLYENKESSDINNNGECIIVNELVNELVGLGVDIRQVGIITPYNGQLKMLKQKVEKDGVEIRTVDGF